MSSSSSKKRKSASSLPASHPSPSPASALIDPDSSVPSVSPSSPLVSSLPAFPTGSASSRSPPGGDSSDSHSDSSGSGSDDDDDKDKDGDHLTDAERAKLKNRGKGSSCHQCKSRRNFIALTYCTSNLANKNKKCRKKFCIAEGAMIALGNGTQAPIESLAFAAARKDQIGPGLPVLSWNPASDADNSLISGGLGIDEAVDFYFQGVRSCVELRFDDRSTVQCTPDHKFVVFDGQQYNWIKARDIGIGARVVAGVEFAVDSRCSLEAEFTLAASELQLSMQSPKERLKMLAFARLLGLFCSVGAVSASQAASSLSAPLDHSLDVSSVLADADLLVPSCVTRHSQQSSGTYSLEISGPLAGSLLNFCSSRVSSSFLILPDFLFSPVCPKAVQREFIAAALGALGNPPSLTDRSVDQRILLSHRLLCPADRTATLDQLGRLAFLLRELGVSGFDVTELTGDDGVPLLCLARISSAAMDFLPRIGFRYSFVKQVQQSAAHRAWRAAASAASQSADDPSAIATIASATAATDFLLRSGALEFFSISKAALHSLHSRQSFPPVFLSLTGRVSLPSPMPVYDLQVLDHFSFLVNTIIVHNCFVGSSLVTLGNGFSRPIREVAVGTGVLSYDAALSGHVIKPTSALLEQGEKEVIELMFSDGRTVQCTPDHRFLQPDGVWIEAKDMIIGETDIQAGVQYPVLSPITDAETNWSLDLTGSLGYQLNVKDRLEHSIAFAGLLGYLLADGSMMPNRAKLFLSKSSIDLKWVQRDIRLLTGGSTMAGKDRELITVNLPGPLFKAMQTIGVFEGDRITSTAGFPAFLLQPYCPIVVVQSFLSGLFGGDGKAPSITWKNGVAVRISEIRFSQSRKGSVLTQATALMTRELQYLMQRLGIEPEMFGTTSSVSQVTSVTAAGAAEIAARKQRGEKLSVSAKDQIDPNRCYSTVWTLSVHSLLKFSSVIGFRYCCHKQICLTAAASYYRLRDLLERQKQIITDTILSEEQKTGAELKGGGFSDLMATVEDAKRVLARSECVHPTILQWLPRDFQRAYALQSSHLLGMTIHEALESFDALKFFSEPRQNKKYSAEERQMKLNASPSTSASAASSPFSSRRPSISDIRLDDEESEDELDSVDRSTSSELAALPRSKRNSSSEFIREPTSDLEKEIIEDDAAGNLSSSASPERPSSASKRSRKGRESAQSTPMAAQFEEKADDSVNQEERQVIALAAEIESARTSNPQPVMAPYAYEAFMPGVHRPIGNRAASIILHLHGPEHVNFGIDGDGSTPALTFQVLEEAMLEADLYPFGVAIHQLVPLVWPNWWDRELIPLLLDKDQKLKVPGGTVIGTGEYAPIARASVKAAIASGATAIVAFGNHAQQRYQELPVIPGSAHQVNGWDMRQVPHGDKSIWVIDCLHPGESDAATVAVALKIAGQLCQGKLPSELQDIDIKRDLKSTVRYGVSADAKALPTFRVKLVARREVPGVQPTYDLTVPDTENFLCQNLCVHNCGHCLKKFYKESPQAITDKNTWKCPSCRKICCCAACRRRKQKDAAGKGEEGHKSKKSKHHEDDSLLAPSQLLSNLSSPSLSAGYELTLNDSLLKDEEFNEYYKYSRHDDDDDSNSDSGSDSSEGEEHRAGGMPTAQFQLLLENHIKLLAAQSSKDRQTPFAVLYKHAQTPRIKQKIIKILESQQIKKDKKVDLIASMLSQLQAQAQAQSLANPHLPFTLSPVISSAGAGAGVSLNLPPLPSSAGASLHHSPPALSLSLQPHPHSVPNQSQPSGNQ